MGARNYLIEGVSCTGKTSVCRELQRRGYHAIDGDRELAYQGDPETGEPMDGFSHQHHIWQVDRVKSLVAGQDDPVTFFCGGSRNCSKFIALFDAVFVLEVDIETLSRRLDERPEDEWGGKQSERDLVLRLHQTKEDIPEAGIVIDATEPLTRVVDEIIYRVEKYTGPANAAADLCAQLSSARQRFLESAQGISDTDSIRRPIANEWSILEILAHMIDVDDYYLGQALLLRDRPGATFTYFNDEAWKREHPSPAGFELTDVLSRLGVSHQRVLAAASLLTDEELARPGVHPRGIPYTVRDILMRFVAHDANHQRQIEETRGQLGF